MALVDITDAMVEPKRPEGPYWDVVKAWRFDYGSTTGDDEVVMLKMSETRLLTITERFDDNSDSFYYAELFSIDGTSLTSLDVVLWRTRAGSELGPWLGTDWVFGQYVIDETTACITWIGLGGVNNPQPTYTNMVSTAGDSISFGPDTLLVDPGHDRARISRGFVVDDRWVIVGVYDAGNDYAAIVRIDTQLETTLILEEFTGSGYVSIADMAAVSTDRLVMASFTPGSGHVDVTLFELNAARDGITQVDTAIVPDFTAWLESEIEGSQDSVQYWYGDSDTWVMWTGVDLFTFVFSILYDVYVDGVYSYSDVIILCATYSTSGSALVYNNDVQIMTKRKGYYYDNETRIKPVSTNTLNNESPADDEVFLYAVYGRGSIPDFGLTSDNSSIARVSLSGGLGSNVVYWFNGLPIEYFNPNWEGEWWDHNFTTYGHTCIESFGNNIIACMYYEDFAEGGETGIDDTIIVFIRLVGDAAPLRLEKRDDDVAGQITPTPRLASRTSKQRGQRLASANTYW